MPGRRILTEAQQVAWGRIKERMRKGWLLDTGKLDRDALHDRDALRREFLKDSE